MTALAEFLIQNFTNLELETWALTPDPDQDIFKGKFGTPNYTYEPRSIYFYYIKILDDGSLRVWHYEDHEEDPAHATDRIKKWKPIPRTKAGLEAWTLKLANNARDRPLPQQDPQKTGDNFSGILWRRRSYIIFFFDHHEWSLYKKSPHGSSVVFLTEKGTAKIIPNHSFFDAQDLDIQLPNGEKRTAIAFINHMKRADEGDLTGTDGPNHDGRETFQFNILLKVRFEDARRVPLDIIIDPGGTNLGPAQEP